jgi:hypothetical protein
LINALGSVAGRLDAPAAAEAAKDLIARLDVKDVESGTQRSLIDVLGSVGGRLDAPAAAEAAKDLIARLDAKDVDPGTQRSLIDALGSVGGRLDAPAAAEVAKDLIARLDAKDVDPETQQFLIDALARMVTISGPHPTTGEIARMRIALASIAWPLRETSESPAWGRLETISGQKFDADTRRLLLWMQACCQLRPTAARSPFSD